MTTPFFMKPFFGLYDLGITKLLNLVAGFTMGLVVGQLIDNYPTWWDKLTLGICFMIPFLIVLYTTELLAKSEELL